jgi:membrane-associated phospholipid phosphatase
MYVPILSIIALAVITLTACSDALEPRMTACAAKARLSTEALASTRWNEVGRNLVVKYRTDPSARPYALLSLAQYAAVVSAESRSGKDCPSDRAAVAGASAAVLTYLYPNEAAALAQLLKEQLDADATRALTGLEWGESIGRDAAEPVITLGRADGVANAWTGTIPTGAGYWVSNGNPGTPQLGQMRPLVLTKGDQFRPAPPPAFHSATFGTALAEVKAIATSRTAEQLQIAQKWALSGGTYRTQGHWNVVATDILVQRGAREREATHTFALLNAAMNDASIACFDAKYTYFLLRPSQADPGIVPAISLPNHPSYPSSHSCTSGAGAAVLGAVFGSEAPRLDAMATEIGLSRLYAGIHYRFDTEVGLDLGRTVAQWTLQVDGRVGLPTVGR